MIRLLIADDSLISRMGLRLMFEDEAGFEVVGEAASGNEAVESTDRLRPDVLLLDIRMPGGNGIEVARRLAAAGSATRVLVLTTFDDDKYVHAEILAAVRSVAAGDARLSPSVTRKVLDVVDLPEPDARISALSGREVELLRLLAEGLTNAEIAARLGLTTGSAKTYVWQLLGKLGARDRVAAVVLAHRSGLTRQA